MRKVIRYLLVVVAALLVLVVGAAVWVGFPVTMAGMAAKTVCSGVFVAGRPAEQVIAEDFLPASPILKFVRVEVDATQRLVHAQVAGFQTRVAQWSAARGCVLDGVSAVAVAPAQAMRAGDAGKPWPLGDAKPAANLAPQLDEVFKQQFAGGQGPRLQNTRALLVVHKGQLLREQYAPGFDASTPLHGWSMTKSLAGMLALKQLQQQGIALDTRVIDLYPADKRPPWWAAWKADERSQITVADMLFMRDGLANTEGYQPWSDVPRMLWGGSDVPAFAAQASAQASAGTRWRYLSATTNLLTHALLARSGLDAAQWVGTVTGPIGATSVVVETDAGGTPVMSSYGWATGRDWARLGWLLMNDGQWPEMTGDAAPGKMMRVLPEGIFKQMATPSLAEGHGAAYGMQVWLQGRKQSQCDEASGVPADVVSMGGHWGQVVVMVPSRELLIVRLGWTMGAGLFDRCALVRDVIRVLGR